MSGHTPGPWVAIFPSERQFYEGRDITNFDVMTEKTRADLRDEGFHHYRPDPGRVDNISIVSMNFWGDMRDEEAKSNARLIAAAPDFYAMAEMVLAWWDKHQYDTISGADGEEWNVHDYEPDFVTTARAAKAKADGETT